MTKIITASTVHKLPQDLKTAITSAPKALAVWNHITPLARNEWICWVISGKKQDTRGIRIQKALSKMKSGMKRPCCWIGCVHRTDKPISRSAQYVLSKTKRML